MKKLITTFFLSICFSFVWGQDFEWAKIMDDCSNCEVVANKITVDEDHGFIVGTFEGNFAGYQSEGKDVFFAVFDLVTGNLLGDGVEVIQGAGDAEGIDITTNYDINVGGRFIITGTFSGEIFTRSNVYHGDISIQSRGGKDFFLAQIVYVTGQIEVASLLTGGGALDDEAIAIVKNNEYEYTSTYVAINYNSEFLTVDNCYGDMEFNYCNPLDNECTLELENKTGNTQVAVLEYHVCGDADDRNMSFQRAVSVLGDTKDATVTATSISLSRVYTVPTYYTDVIVGGYFTGTVIVDNGKDLNKIEQEHTTRGIDGFVQKIRFPNKNEEISPGFHGTFISGPYDDKVTGVAATSVYFDNDHLLNNVAVTGTCQGWTQFDHLDHEYNTGYQEPKAIFTAKYLSNNGLFFNNQWVSFGYYVNKNPYEIHATDINMSFNGEIFLTGYFGDKLNDEPEFAPLAFGNVNDGIFTIESVNGYDAYLAKFSTTKGVVEYVKEITGEGMNNQANGIYLNPWENPDGYIIHDEVYLTGIVSDAHFDDDNIQIISNNNHTPFIAKLGHYEEGQGDQPDFQFINPSTNMVYPNPAVLGGQISISVPSEEIIQKVEFIHTIDGSVLEVNNFNESNTFSTHQLVTGNYIMRVITKTNAYAQLIIIE